MITFMMGSWYLYIKCFNYTCAPFASPHSLLLPSLGLLPFVKCVSPHFLPSVLYCHSYAECKISGLGKFPHRFQKKAKETRKCACVFTALWQWSLKQWILQKVWDERNICFGRQPQSKQSEPKTEAIRLQPQAIMQGKGHQGFGSYLLATTGPTF